MEYSSSVNLFLGAARALQVLEFAQESACWQRVQVWFHDYWRRYRKGCSQWHYQRSHYRLRHQRCSLGYNSCWHGPNGSNWRWQGWPGHRRHRQSRNRWVLWVPNWGLAIQIEWHWWENQSRAKNRCWKWKPGTWGIVCHVFFQQLLFFTTVTNISTRTLFESQNTRHMTVCHQINT